MASASENKPATKKELEGEIEALKYMFPNIKIETYTDYIKTVNGPAQGRVVEFGTIMLSNLAESGIVFHEAWHQLSRHILPANEAIELWDEVRALKGEVFTYKGDRKKFSDLTNREADEYLAEEFRLTMLTHGRHKVGATRIKNWFEKSIDLLDAIFAFSEVGGLFAKYLEPRSVIEAEFGRDMAKAATIFQKLRSAHYADAIKSPTSIG